MHVTLNSIQSTMLSSLQHHAFPLAVSVQYIGCLCCTQPCVWVQTLSSPLWHVSYGEVLSVPVFQHSHGNDEVTLFPLVPSSERAWPSRCTDGDFTHMLVEPAKSYETHTLRNTHAQTHTHTQSDRNTHIHFLSLMNTQTTSLSSTPCHTN